MKKEDTIVSGLFWTFCERVLAQFVSLIVTVILARILLPEQYGIVAIVTIFISFCDVFAVSGFGSSLIQKKDATFLDFNTTLILSEIISVILYLILFFIAPTVANFYNIPELTIIMRVMGLRIPLASFNSIQQAYIQKNMQFKKFFILTTIGTTISAFLGVIAAIKGLGVWALVIQYLSNSVIDTISLQFISSWHPKIEFSKSSAKKIFNFGWKVLLTNLVFTIEGDIKSLIIGKAFGKKELAYYDQGRKYPAILVGNISSSINRVMLPAYSKTQDNIHNLKELLRESIRVGTFFLAPILIGFTVVAPDFIGILLTDKWNGAIIFLQICCISYITRPLESSCHQALLAIGRSDIVLYIMLIIHSTSLIWTLFSAFVLKSIIWIALGSLVTSIVSLICFLTMTKRHIKYNYKEQIQDIFPYIAFSIIMGLIVLIIDFIKINLYVLFIIKILTGIICYTLFVLLKKPKAYLTIYNRFLKRK